MSNEAKPSSGKFCTILGTACCVGFLASLGLNYLLYTGQLGTGTQTFFKVYSDQGKAQVVECLTREEWDKKFLMADKGE